MLKSAKPLPIAKITSPRCTEVLCRERLFRILDSLRQRPVTWIAAPAGFGKTTLVASYLTQKNISSLWYSLDERDSDTAIFFHFMGLAARTAMSMGRKSCPLPSPEDLKEDHAFTLRYFGNLYDLLRAPSFIVLDDYQRVPAGSIFHESIAAGLDMLPEGVRVLVLSRENPPARFARLKANGRIGLVRAEELRFTLEETGKVLHLKGMRDMPHGTVRRIYERTLGWAAGLGLMMENAEKREEEYPEIADLASKDIFDYFATEILDEKDRETQNFLMKTAFLPWITDAWAEELTGLRHSGEILAGFFRDRFFTERNGGPNNVYRYYPLFREFLLSRAKDSFSADELATIKRSSALLMEGVDRSEGALEILIEARDWDCLARLVAKDGWRFASHWRIEALRKCLSAIPEKIIEAEPWLLYWLGVATMTPSPSESRRHFEHAFQIFNDRKDDEGVLASWAGAVNTFFYEYIDFKPLDTWIDWLEDRIRRTRSFPSPEIEATVTASMACALVWRRPTHEGTKRWIARALPLSPSNGDEGRSQCGHAEALNCGLIYDESIRSVEFLPGPPLALLAAVVLEAHYHILPRETYEQVVHVISEGLAMADKSGIHRADPWLIAQGAYCALNAGDVCMLGQYLSRMEEVLEKSRSVEYMLYCNLACLKALLAGNMSDALALADDGVRAAGDAGIPIGVALGKMLAAQAACELGDKAVASQQLREAEDFFLTMGSQIFEFSCELIKAYSAFRNGHEGDASASLLRALRLGRRNGYVIAPYLWRPQVWSLLCAKALEAGIEVDYVCGLIRKQGLAPEGSAAQLENWPWPMKVSALGRFELVLNGEPMHFSGKSQKKPLLLLKMLIALGGCDVREEHLSDLLWPEADGDRAHSSFTTTLSRLRRLIGFDKAIEVHDGRVSLNSRYCWVDARAFEKISREADLLLEEFRKGGGQEDRSRDKTLQLARIAVDMYKGSLLGAEADDAWATPLRERLNNRFLRLTIKYGRYLEAMELWDEAARLYSRGLEIDEIESHELHQRLTICHDHLGQPVRLSNFASAAARTRQRSLA